MKARTRVHPPDGAEPVDTRDPKELSAVENANLCEGCVKCCTYITVEIDPPRAAWEYDQWIWALHHRGIQIYVEFPEAWYVHFETVCEQLNEAGRCSIYGRHPVLCREYDPRNCERRVPLTEVRAWFDHGQDLENWLREKRPAHYRRLMEFRRDMPQGPPIADARKNRGLAAGLVSIASSAATARPVNGSAVGGKAPVARPRGRRT
jgi:Fe-S-cluster containining protein